jgi:hypothetical protein
VRGKEVEEREGLREIAIVFFFLCIIYEVYVVPNKE